MAGGLRCPGQPAPGAAAAENIETVLTARADPRERFAAHLRAVADELAPASAQFYLDLASFEPAADVYRQNTAFAARRVHDLVTEGVEAGTLRPVDAAFVGAAASLVMTAIQNGQIQTATGLDDACAYVQLPTSSWAASP